MCDVNDCGDSAGDTPPIEEDDALEKIFSECDVTTTGRVSVSRLIGYMRDHMSSHGSPEILKDLRKSMSEASEDGEVTREKYYDVSKNWLAKIRKRQNYLDNNQDGNNNLNVSHHTSFIDENEPHEHFEGPHQIRTTLVLSGSAKDLDVSNLDSVSESNPKSLQGFLDLSSSTVVDTTESRDALAPFFGDLSSVDAICDMAIDNPVVETALDLRQRAQRCAVDNDHLREELQRAEDIIATLERQLSIIGRKLELANSRYERLQGEHTEHKELLETAEGDLASLEAQRHRLEKENSKLKKDIEAAETEVRRLNVELDRLNEQREERIRLLSRCREELIDRQKYYNQAKEQISKLEIANDQLKEKFDTATSTNEHLKVVVKELETRISELQPNQNYILRGEALFSSPSSDNRSENEIRMLGESEKMIPCSLHDEMKAVGYGDSEMINLNETMSEDQNISCGEYIDAIRWATERLERAAAEFAASQKTLGIGSPPARSAEIQISKSEGYHSSSSEDLQWFKSQVRHVLTIFSTMASQKVVNSDTKDATTHIDPIYLVPELPTVSDTNEEGVNINNNNDNKFCPTCGRESNSICDSKPGIGIVRSSGLFIPPLIVSTSPVITSTPCSSPKRISSPFSSEYFHERDIIAPIVAAMDEIIEGANATGNKDDNYQSSVESRREHNPRCIYTLPSSCPSELEGDISSYGTESLLSKPADSHKSSSNKTIEYLRSESSSESGSRSGIPELSAWRCQASTTIDDTSDDTCGMSSNESQTPSFEDTSWNPSLLDLSGSKSSLQSIEEGDFNRVANSHEAKDAELINRDQILSRNSIVRDRQPDVVEDLNLDLEKLTLRTGTTRANCQRSSDEHRLYNVTPKRKSSVYQRSFDCHNSLNGDERISNSSTIVRHSAVTDPHTLLERSSSGMRRSTSHPVGYNELEDIPEKKQNQNGGTFDTPKRASIVEPEKSEVIVGNNQWIEYVISDANLSRTPTRCLLPSSDEILGDVAYERQSSSGREIPSRSRSVARAMSSEEDSSDSECARDRIDREQNAQVVSLPLPPPPSSSTSSSSPPQTTLIQSHTQAHPQSVSQQPQLPLQHPDTEIKSTLLFGDTLTFGKYGEDNGRGINAEELDGKKLRPAKNIQRLRRSLSESDSGPCRGCAECKSKYNCNCGWDGARNKNPSTQDGVSENTEAPHDPEILTVFPNLPDARLIELGLSGSSDGFNLCERMTEDELERKYTALSIGLGTDRATLPRRLTLSIRQRDQAERNLTTEVERMQRDIQALAPLCVDRESVERVERVKHQLEMISRCALRVSCTAELLGATHQERRVSRAALLADRYLQALRSRCEKLSAELAETKRILTENNIVFEENSNDLLDDIVPRLRYRGVPSANRTTMSRRRASIATITRPATINSPQEGSKDNSRPQRTSVPARITLRRPSLGYDTQRWENEKLDRTDSSSSSIGELRDIFEQAESRRDSREENNNLIRSQSSNFSVGSCESGDSDAWATTREDPVTPQNLTKEEPFPAEDRPLGHRTPLVLKRIQERASSLPISWYILFVAVFFFGFYSNHYVTTRSVHPLKWWSIDEIVKRYLHVRRNVPPPI